MDAQELAGKHNRTELEELAAGIVDDPDSYDTKLELAEAMLENGFTEAPDPTTFEAAQGVNHVVNTPLNKFGLPDPDRVVTDAKRDDDGNVTYEGG